jgi:hypothetical protein
MMAAATKTPVVTAQMIRSALCVDAFVRTMHRLLDAVGLFGDVGRIKNQDIT